MKGTAGGTFSRCELEARLNVTEVTNLSQRVQRLSLEGNQERMKARRSALN